MSDRLASINSLYRPAKVAPSPLRTAEARDEGSDHLATDRPPQIVDGSAATIYLEGAAGEVRGRWLRRLEARRVRAVTAFAEQPGGGGARLRQVVAGTTGVAIVDDRLERAAVERAFAVLDAAVTLDLPLAVVRGRRPSVVLKSAGGNAVAVEAGDEHRAIVGRERLWGPFEATDTDTDTDTDTSIGRGFDDFLDHASAAVPARPAYAFLAVRIHDDFALVREAVGAAVEQALGMPCLFFDDERAIVAGVGARERTKRLIRHAELVIADLTFGPDNPRHDSPNTAHEIGMALAYDRPLVICAQGPRRDLYFNVGDLRALFWRDEADLHSRLKARLAPRRAALGRRWLTAVQAPDAARPAVGPASFAMDPARRYRAPGGFGARLRRLLASPRS